MYRLDDPATLANGGVPTLGNPYTGRAASVLDPRHYWTHDEELANAVEGMGLTLNRDDRTQLLQAIQATQPGAGASSGIGQALSAPLPGIALDAQTPRSWGAHGVWIAGTATEAPYQGTSSGGSGGPLADPNDNTEQANEYETGLHPGELFPYMVCNSQAVGLSTGPWPSCYSGSGTNHYESGFLIPGWSALGSCWEFDWFGEFSGIPGKCLEWVCDPNTVANGYNGLPSHAFAFQTPNMVPTGLFVNARPFRARLRHWLSYAEGGAGPAAGNWIVQTEFDFRAGIQAPVTAVLEYRAIAGKSYAEAVVDWTEPVKLGLRFKATDVGQPLGATSNQASSPDTSTQGGTQAFGRIIGFCARWWPGSHAFD